jgi:hypothetical protein
LQNLLQKIDVDGRVTGTRGRSIPVHGQGHKVKCSLLRAILGWGHMEAAAISQNSNEENYRDQTGSSPGEKPSLFTALQLSMPECAAASRPGSDNGCMTEPYCSRCQALQRRVAELEQRVNDLTRLLDEAQRPRRTWPSAPACLH